MYGCHSLSILQYTAIRYGKENKELEHRGVPDIRREDPRVPPRQESNFSLYDSEANQSQLSHRDDISETDSERRMVKRKVLR